MIFTRVAQIAIVATGFYERSIEVFLVVFTSESGNVLTNIENVHFSSSLRRPMETSWRNTTSRHRDNVHVYDK